MPCKNTIGRPRPRSRERIVPAGRSTSRTSPSAGLADIAPHFDRSIHHQRLLRLPGHSLPLALTPCPCATTSVAFKADERSFAGPIVAGLRQSAVMADAGGLTG